MKPKPKPKSHEQSLIATTRLDLSIDMDHELARLAQAINLESVADAFRPM